VPFLFRKEKNMEEFYFASLIRRTLERIHNHYYQDLLCHASDVQEKNVQIAGHLRKLQKALSRNWMNAARRCRNMLEISFNNLPLMLNNLEQSIARPEPMLPSLKDLMAEMKQITDELGDIRFNRKEHSLSITTEPITLNGIFLGDFEIRLEVNRIPEMHRCSPFLVIALDPHPAASSDEVTHPHVSSEILCEGDGHTAIREALRQGRLFDFFNMISAILNTYNPSSPYVSLDVWEGTTCYDCGRGLCDDERYYCENCGNDFCESCSACCPSCQETTCISCAGACEICGETICKHCVRKCKECDNMCCKHCIEDGLCNSCIEEKNDEQIEQQPTNDNPEKPIQPIPTVITAVQPDGMGQAAVLSGQIPQ
jgi:hypothetical protein